MLIWPKSGDFSPAFVDAAKFTNSPREPEARSRIV
ncbi:hypothetical protein RB2501_14854 [Robiginitalea biformata HTCC2501]|uniref:Uncharacterized protein n=1 Tax=Robiginitalea biformata (strain ATCC BAA-864 / DSM 15991 / KCTC 12146 / HTCC2501) TaxID=313596 RepID=A4CL68_ROBBH|nr:hypothetical protein RB2501_14854 [Robiginitalea biformata HTCC2501]